MRAVFGVDRLQQDRLLHRPGAVIVREGELADGGGLGEVDGTMSIRVSARQTSAQQPEASFAIQTKCIKIFRTVRQRQRLGLAVERHPSQREAVLGEAAYKDRVAQNGQGRRGQERRGQRKRLIFIVKFAASGFNWRGGGSAVQCCSGLRVGQGDGSSPRAARHSRRAARAAEKRQRQAGICSFHNLQTEKRGRCGRIARRSFVYGCWSRNLLSATDYCNRLK